MEVLASRHVPERGMFEMVQEVTDESGQSKLYLAFYPDDILEWRCAEYMINSNEVDLLMDIVLYERYIPQQSGPSDLVLVNASTLDEARVIHTNNVMKAKQLLRPQGPNKWKTNGQRKTRMAQAHEAIVAEWESHLTTDALEAVRDNHVMDPEVVIAKMEKVRSQREHALRRKAERTATAKQGIIRPTPQQRAAAIRGVREGRRSQ